LEADFFMFHLYQTVSHIAILLMLFYMEDQWAYMIATLASVPWLILSFERSLLGAALRQLFLLSRARAVSNQVSVVAGITSLSLCY
jgi:hypothetical protein